MAPSAALVSSKVDASYSVIITCDFEADLSNKKLDKSFPLPDVPLAGNWVLDLEGTKDGVRVDVIHDGLRAGRCGSAVDCRFELYWSEGGVFKLVQRGWSPVGPLPSANDAGENINSFPCLDPSDKPFKEAGHLKNFNSTGHHRYRLVLKLRQDSLRAENEVQRSGALADTLATLSFQPTPHNFRLFFPKLGKEGAALWVDAGVLSYTCPYFEDLLASGFAEATPRRSKRARISGAQLVDCGNDYVDDKDLEDSDDETDEFRFAEFSITHTAFSTYHTLLTFLQTGYLHFAPLKSACKPSNPAGTGTRGEFLAEAHEDNPSLPLPVSPKSLYRLVDLLRIPDDTGLAALCLDTFSNSLTFDGAAHELFSDASRCFEPVRKAVLAYVVANWDKVSETASWKECAARMKAGEMHEVAGIMMELVEAKDQATKKKG